MAESSSNSQRPPPTRYKPVDDQSCRKALNTLAWVLLIATIIFSSVKPANGQAQIFSLASISVANSSTSATTTLYYTLELRLESDVKVEELDSLEFLIPDDTTAKWDVRYEPDCAVSSGAVILGCEIRTSKVARITLGAQDNRLISGSITQFVNPQAVRPIFGIQVTLLDSIGNARQRSTNLQLLGFEPAQMSVHLVSSNPVIGSTGNMLEIRVNPWTVVPGRGLLVVHFPEYYEGAGADYFIADLPEPCSLTVDRRVNGIREIVMGDIDECIFSMRQNQVEIHFIMPDELALEYGDQCTFEISRFKNPLSEINNGFGVELFDEDEYSVADTGLELGIDGVSEPSIFSQYAFIYADYANNRVSATHTFTLTSAMPIPYGCLIKIIYPSEFSISSELTTISGTGFLQGEGSAPITFTAEPYENREILFSACKENFGSITTGSLTLALVHNQEQKKETASFQIFMTDESDTAFEHVFQQITEGFSVGIEQQKAGFMTGEIEPSSLVIQTATTFRFTLQPSNQLTTEAYAVIEFPETLQFQHFSCTVSATENLSRLVNCVREGQKAIIRNLFDAPYDPELSEPFKMTIEMLEMPESQQNLGTIEINILDYVQIGDSGEFEYVEQDVIEFEDLQSESGELVKTAEVENTSGQMISSASDQTYEFYFKLYHRLPVGGIFRIEMSTDQFSVDGVTIPDPDLVESQCFLGRSGTFTSVSCVTDTTLLTRQPYVDITLGEEIYGSDGSPRNQEVTLRIGGLTNPRAVGYLNQFAIKTLDRQERPIDNNKNDIFSIETTEMNNMVGVAVSMQNRTNGAYGDYIISVTPASTVYTDDVFTIKFPPEIVLDEIPECSRHTDSYILEIECVKYDDQLVEFTFIGVDTAAAADGDSFSLTIHNARNPLSLRPTGAFSEIYMSAAGLYNMSIYETDFHVATDTLGKLPVDTASISQNVDDPNEENQISIDFETNNPLPTEAVVIVTVPQVIPNIITEAGSCTAFLNGVPQPQFDNEGRRKCMLDNNRKQVTFLHVFENYPYYEGPITLVFKVTNPSFNSEELIEEPYGLRIYDNTDMNYGIDELDSNLLPSLDCRYPCNTCQDTNPDYCLTCLASETAPQFLHTVLGTDYQTCVNECPEEHGYTSNGSLDPRICQQCHHTCATCAQNDLEGDINLCTSCSDFFPYLWESEFTCHSDYCPDGSYLSNENTCATCSDECYFCSGPQTCTKCRAGTNLQYLYDGQCLASCPSGYTSIDNVCVQCSPPCDTCLPGSPNSCTSCDNSGGRQFLYGLSCLTECPVNTTLQFESSQCIECLPGCASCDPRDHTICLKCSPGLALLDNVCMIECPFDYLKSDDGSVCEARTYLLDEEFIVLPFLQVALLFVLVTVASYWLTGRRSLVSSSLIAFFGPVEVACVVYQIYYAIKKGYTAVLIGSLYCLAASFVANIVYMINYYKQVKGTDRQFTRWAKQKWIASSCMMIFTGMISMTMHRLLFVRLFRLEFMSMKVSRPKQFLRPFFIFTWVKFVIFNVPLIIVDLIGTSQLPWGNQCHMTMFESCTLSFLTMLLMIYEGINRDELLLREQIGLRLEKIESDEENKDKDKPTHAGGRQFPEMTEDFSMDNEGAGLLRMQNRAGISLNQIKTKLMNNVTLTELRDAENRQLPTPRTMKKRIEQFQHCISLVKRNKDLFLNNQLDEVLEVEFENCKTELRRTKSMVDMRVEQLEKDDSSSSFCESYPGVAYDETEKLKEFHTYMDELAQEAADVNNKGEQYEDPISENLYASARDPDPEIEMESKEQQTEQEKGDLDVMGHDRMRQQMLDSVLEAVMIRHEEEASRIASKARKNTKTKRGGKRSHYGPIEQDEPDSEKSDRESQAKIGTNMVDAKKNMLSLAMQLEKEKSLTSLYELSQADRERLSAGQSTAAKFEELKGKVTAGEINISAEELERINQELQDERNSGFTKGIELSKVSGDLDFTSDEEEEAQKMLQDEEAVKISKKYQMDNVDGWIKDQATSVNQRTFNENEIIGNFERDWTGGIKDRDFVIRKNHFQDNDGNAVNARGYLIDEEGNLRSKYTFENVFSNVDLVRIDQGSKLRIELPLPYRMERFNFNPHEIMGYFDYQKGMKMVPLQDSNGNWIDKYFRRVNKGGWLINGRGDIIDNLGRIRFVKEQLVNDEIPELYNYDGEPFNIKDIIGHFKRAPNSKEIVIGMDYDQRTQKNTTVDITDRKVNPKGYLLDNLGNIVNREKKIIFSSHELLYNEPPKFFRFTRFSKLWIQGYLDRDVTQNPRHDDVQDLNGRLINKMGYLCNEREDIVDTFSENVLFKKDLLQQEYNQECKLPKLFREDGLLMEPERDNTQRWLENRIIKAKKRRAKKKSPKPDYGLSYHKADSEDSPESDFDVEAEAEKLEKRARGFRQGEEQFDQDGVPIDAIPMSEENYALEAQPYYDPTRQVMPQQMLQPEAMTHHQRSASALGGRPKAKKPQMQGNKSATQLRPGGGKDAPIQIQMNQFMQE